jgi:uncharacterized protein (TIGR03437 family)
LHRWILASFCIAALTGEERQASFGAKLWPSGRIPYEVSANFRLRDCLDQAVREWNTRTIIRLTPRSGEADYLVFTPAPRSLTIVGMVGGAQPVFLEDGTCEFGIYRTMVHEIGHAVGLSHEHQRSDRDRFIRVQPEFSNLSAQDLTTILGSPVGPYDYASVMHYGPLGGGTGAAIVTIPPGIPTGLDQGTAPMLSPGDLDAVQRIYGEAPKVTTISTNPAGLEVIVDGERRVAPLTVNWVAGTQHSLDVPSPQTREGARYEFGRWNDDGRRTQTVTAGVLTHWAANFVSYVRVRGVSNEEARGAVMVDSPDGSAGPADGLRLLGSSVRVRAMAAPGFFLRTWEGGRGTRNPLVFPVFHPDPAVNAFVARFEPYPVTTITSQPVGLQATVNGVTATTPAQFRWEPGTVQAIDFTREVVQPGARYKLEVIRTEAPVQSPGRIIATPYDANIVAVYRTDYPVRVSVSPANAGQVAVTPALADGYAILDDRLQIRATPAAGFRFVRWRGADGADANPLAVAVRGAVELVAEFAPASQPVNVLSVRNAASGLAGGVAPGEIVSVFSSAIGEGVRVQVNGMAAPILAVVAGQVNCIVPYGVAGQAKAVFTVTREGTSVETEFPLVDAAPALFTADSSGTGAAAAFMQDGVAVLFGTGEGMVEPAVADGSIAAEPLSRPRFPVSVEINGKDARVLYAGPSPGSVYGLLQINVELPADAGGGPVPVVLKVGQARSAPGVTLLLP